MNERMAVLSRTTTRKRLRTPTRAALVVLAFTLAIGTASATMLFFTQVVPTTPVPSSTITGCPTLSFDGAVSGSNGTASYLVFNCGSAQAVLVSTDRSYFPTFSKPLASNNLTDMFLVPSTLAGSPTSTPATPRCGDFVGAIAFGTGGSGNANSVPTGNYDYCFDSVSPGATVSSFSVAWT